MQSIAIAGASGFVGSALIEAAAKDYKVIALTRGKPRPDPAGKVEWRSCDLFSKKQAENALQGVDYAFYLVHSMLPSHELTQGRFQDMDLLVAENFSSSAALNGVKQIIYLGGIIPDSEELSPHLASRLEVEKALATAGVPVTSLRAALIMGPSGSSMEMMFRLVERLPIMICPSWTSTVTMPIYIDDVTSSLLYCLGKEEHYSKVYDIAGSTALNYREMMQEVAKHKGLKRLVLQLPLFSRKLSRLWVSLVSGAPRNLVSPLIESLRHRMVPEDNRLLRIPGSINLSFEQSLEKCLEKKSPSQSKPRAYVLPEDERKRKTVLSIQRLFKPKAMSANDVAKEYLNWLPRQLFPVINVVVEENTAIFKIFGLPWDLLVIERCEERSSEERALFYIKGGLLTRVAEGRLEFRATYDSMSILAAVHDFQPSLPWYVYRYTQALMHLWVMRSFNLHLKKM